MKENFKGVLFPSQTQELEHFMANRKSSEFLVISNSLPITLYCQEHRIPFTEEFDIIDREKYASVSVRKLFDSWLNDLARTPNDTHKRYLYTLEYSVSNLIKTKEYVKNLFDGLVHNYDFDEVFLFDYKSPNAFSRENTDAYKKWILTIHMAEAGIKFTFEKGRTLKMYIQNLIFFTASKLPNLALYAEVWLRWLISKPSFVVFMKLLRKKYDSPQYLFFSSGRDAVFHNILLEGSGISNLVVSGSSKHDKNIKGRSVVPHDIDIKSFLAAGSLKLCRTKVRSLSQSELKGLLLPDFADTGKSKFATSTFLNYLTYRYLRDVNLIRFYEGGIKLLKPSVVFCTSLFLPVLAAKNQNVPTVTQAEGVGIDYNPMAPCPGDMILSPSQAFSDQISHYSRETGQVELTGPYYYE